MALPMKPLPQNDELDALLKQAKKSYGALSPDQQKEMWRAQRKSWVIGEMMLEHPEMTREKAEEIYERVTW